MTAIQYISQLPSAATPARTDLVPVTQGSTGALSGTTRKLLMSAFADGLPVLATGSTTSRTLATRFADVANVRDFGAVGDGVTDDSAAFAAALSAASSARGVVVAPFSPAGYVLKNISVPGGVTLDMSGSKIWPAPAANYAVQTVGYGATFRNFVVDDYYANTVRATTRASGGGIGATTIVVTNSAGMAADQWVAIEQTDGFWYFTVLTGVAGSTLTFRDAMTVAAATGGRVWATYGALRMSGTWGRMHDGQVVNGQGALVLDAANADVSKNFVQSLNIDTCKIFGIVKGRNASVNTISNVAAFGGWISTATGTANGINTDWTLPDNVFLRREVYASVNGVSKSYTTDFTVVNDASGRPRIVRFNVAPANGATVSVTALTYGVRGIWVDGGATSYATGGNNFIDCNVLQWQDGIYLKSAQLYSFTGCISDTNSRTGLTADGATYMGDIWSIFLGWAPTLVACKYSTTGVYVHSSTTNTLPTNTSIAGTAGVVGNVDGTSGINWRQAGWTGNTTAVGDWTGAGAPSAVYFNPSIYYSEDGSVSSPALSWKGATTSGWYRYGTTSIGYSAGGSFAMGISSRGAELNGGSVASPSLALSGSSIGVYFPTTSTLAFTDGTNKLAEITTGVFGFSVPVAFLGYEFASVPSAATNSGRTIRITDRNNRLATSDGTNWRWAGDGTVIS